jgi:hypothetical protein
MLARRDKNVIQNETMSCFTETMEVSRLAQVDESNNIVKMKNARFYIAVCLLALVEMGLTSGSCA